MRINPVGIYVAPYVYMPVIGLRPIEELSNPDYSLPTSGDLGETINIYM